METIKFQNNVYYTMQSENLPMLNEAGIHAEFKYHLMKSILFYSTLNYNQTFTPIPNTILRQNLPIYGNAGFKYSGKIVSAQLWTHYNMGERIVNATSSRYAMHYGLNDINGYRFSGYFTLNAFVKTQLNKKIDFGMRMENILDANYRSYLSTIHGLGRNFTLQLQFVI
jgi:outer membrane receptor protein involved in Fe transport